ncbi:MAG: hypothetical protein IH571_02795 [Acholeplasmataceae bacterium]|nr:hypothetical protein [Acholeplasmataceae bacterium]
MIRQAFLLQLKKKYIIQGALFFGFFILIYTLLDRLNMTYPEMAIYFGSYLVILNITLNIIMSFMGALLMNLSTAMVELKGKEGKASNFGVLSILFGILTYGCTTCVIAFFASIGIAFGVFALPLAGFPYKMMAFGLLLIGIFWMLHEIKHGKCKVKLEKKKI